MNRSNISFAGAGRVASALCKELYSTGYRIDLIVSESENSSRILAESCQASWSSELNFPQSTDIIIIAVPDRMIKSVLSTLKCGSETLVVHTAGSIGLDIFPEHYKRKGIFYPLQTFSTGRQVKFNKLPFLLETSDNESSGVLKDLAESMGGEVHFVDSERRRMLHLAAVFVCNFTNYMLTAGQEVASKAGFDAGVLEPLIKETISKAIDIGPESSQTGPAIRNDLNTIEKHLELLSFSPELQGIYKEMTSSIIKYYKDKGQKY